MLKKININFVFFLLVVIASFIFVLNFNKGLETTDESYSLLYSIYTKDVIGKVTNFGLLGNYLLKLTNYNIYFFRIIGFIILLGSSFLLFKSFTNFLKRGNITLLLDKYLTFAAVIVGCLCYYRFWVITPNYNLYNLCGALIFMSGLINFDTNKIIKKNLINILITCGGLLICFISKPSSAIFFSFIALFWFYFFSKINFYKIIIIHVIVGFLIFLSYVYLNNQNLNLYVKDLLLGYTLKQTIDPRYNFLELFIFTIKFLVKDSLNHWIFFLLQIFLSFLLNKFEKIKNFVVIFPLTSLLIYNNLNILFLSILIVLFFFVKKNFFNNKENVLIILFPLIIFFITFGTNTNPVRHTQTSGIFHILAILYMINYFNVEKVIKNFLILSILLTQLIYNAKDNIFYPQRYKFNILNQQNHIKIQRFNGSIKVDDFMKSYYDQTLNLRKKISDFDQIEYLIDYTGRQPILNLLFGLKFISQPWWTSGYSGSESYVNMIQKISEKSKFSKSLVVTYEMNDLQELDIQNLISIGIDLEKDYTILGVIDLSEFTGNKNYNFKVWMPK